MNSASLTSPPSSVSIWGKSTFLMVSVSTVRVSVSPAFSPSTVAPTMFQPAGPFESSRVLASSNSNTRTCPASLFK